MYVGLNDRDPAWHDLYQVTISTGERTLLRKNTEQDRRLGVRRGRQAASGRAQRRQRRAREILRVDEDGFTKVYTCSVFETCAPVRFHKDGTPRLHEHQQGRRRSDRAWCCSTRRRARKSWSRVDPEKRVDLGSAIFSDVTDELLATHLRGRADRAGTSRTRRSRPTSSVLEKQFPGKRRHLPSSHDRRTSSWLVVAASDTDPGETYLFDRSDEEADAAVQASARSCRASTLAPMTAIRYPSSDGLEIPAYLTLPKGVPAKTLPLVVVPHGGPWARDTWGYDTYAQFLANRGYAVLQPNFRGSTGYGKKFLNAGNKQWGDKMQDDLTWGVKHLVAEGHRRSEARRHHGRLLRRLRHARRRRVHARPLRGRRVDRRPVEPDHAARLDPARTGSRSGRSSTSAWATRRRRRARRS